jgi:hypothetical protein
MFIIPFVQVAITLQPEIKLQTIFLWQLDLFAPPTSVATNGMHLKGDMKTWLDSMQKTHKIYLWLVQITSIKHVLRQCPMNFGGQEVINFKFGFVLLVFKQFYLHYLYLSISQ